MTPEDFNPATMDRRNFIKRSSLTAGAITILGQGLSLGDPISGATYPLMKQRTFTSSTTYVGLGATAAAALKDAKDKATGGGTQPPGPGVPTGPETTLPYPVGSNPNGPTPMPTPYNYSPIGTSTTMVTTGPTLETYLDDSGNLQVRYRCEITMHAGSSIQWQFQQ